ncbi:MAG: class I SAM-dependent methyltransferase [bacterium]|nr:class I SAM-dependent methyltransferase [bacterium]
MLKARLRAIANYINKRDNAVDIGADHGYLGIYLVQNHLVNSIILTDIKKSALDVARRNVEASSLNIPLILTDGLNGVDTAKLNTVIISGMGTSTILQILNNPVKMQSINKLVLQSNNDLFLLRKEVIKLGFSLIDETTVYENSFWYVVCLFEKTKTRTLTSKELKYGLVKEDKKEYYLYLLNRVEEILKNMEESTNENKKAELLTTKEELSQLIIEKK